MVSLKSSRIRFEGLAHRSGFAPAAFEAAQEFMQVVMPRYADRIKLYDNSEPMFHKYGIEDEIARIQRRHVPLHPDGLGLIAYGHYGRPVLAFPSQQGDCWDYENRGMIAAIAGLIDAGRAKVYCVDTIDGQTWHDASLPLEERARRHGGDEDWIVNHVAPFIHADCGGAQEIIVNGPRRSSRMSSSSASADKP